jgi:hypothetical protein
MVGMEADEAEKERMELSGGCGAALSQNQLSLQLLNR